MAEQCRDLGGTKVAGVAGVVQLGAPQRLIGVDVADTGDETLIEQRALDSGLPLLEPGTELLCVEQSIQRVASNVGDLDGQLRPALAEQHAAEDALVDKSQLAAIRQVEGYPQVLLRRRIGLVDQHLTAHTEVAQHRIVIELHPEVLAATSSSGDSTSREAIGEVNRSGQVAAHGSDVVNRGLLDRAADDMGGDPAAYDLYFRQFRHRSVQALSRDVLMARHAISATICSASFFERPMPPVYDVSPTTTAAVNVLS